MRGAVPRRAVSDSSCLLSGCVADQPPVGARIRQWVGLGIAGLVAVLAVLSFFLPSNNVLIWGGIYGAIAAVIVAIMQSNLTIVNRLMGFLLEVFYWRTVIYIVLSIPCFFHVVLIVGGIALDLLAIAYFVAACFFKVRACVCLRRRVDGASHALSMCVCAGTRVL